MYVKSQVSPRSLYILYGLGLALSLAAQLINHFHYHYIGNNYFPENVFTLALFLILLNLGFIFTFNKDSIMRPIGMELFYFFAVMCLIAFATNKVQYTPFPIIDHSIVSLETYFHIHMENIVTWTNNHRHFKYILGIIYDSLNYQMCILPLLIIFTGRFHLIREYYFFLLCTSLIGFGFYYFFPTTAPASVFNRSLFFPEQIDTSLKFRQIHHFMSPTTNKGGLIAFPSFHMIWAILCVNLLREWTIPCVVLSIINFLLISSCVLLGWHYITDIAGSLIVLLISYYIFRHSQIEQYNRS